MKDPTLNTLKYIVFLAAGLALAYYLFNSFYTPSFINDLKSVSLFWLSLAVLAVLTAHIFRALRWQLMIRPLTNKNPGFFKVFNALMVGYLVNLALPRAGELARCVWLAKKEKLETTSLVGSVIAERIIDLIMLLILLVISLTVYHQILLSFFNATTLIALVQAKFWLVGLALLIGLGLLAIIIKLAKKDNPFALRLKELIQKLWKGFLSIKQVKNRLGFVCFTFLIWFFYIASTYFGFKMLQQTEALSFFDALLTLVAASFGMVAPIQGGIGAFHFMVSECLILLGINGSIALVYATVLHATQTLLTALCGLLALMPSFGFTSKKYPT